MEHTLAHGTIVKREKINIYIFDSNIIFEEVIILGIFNLGKKEENNEEEYVELDFNSNEEAGKTYIKVEKMEGYADSEKVQRDVRDGYIVLADIKELKEKDINELKRAITRIRKTCVAINGDIAGVGEDWIIVTPDFARVYREPENEDQSELEK